MAGTYSNYSGTASDTCADPTWGVLKHDTVFRRKTEFASSEEEWVWGGLAGLETLVVCGNGYLGWGNTNASHATICCNNDKYYA
jgi:hypothetical protein